MKEYKLFPFYYGKKEYCLAVWCSDMSIFHNVINNFYPFSLILDKQYKNKQSTSKQ